MQYCLYFPSGLIIWRYFFELTQCCICGREMGCLCFSVQDDNMQFVGILGSWQSNSAMATKVMWYYTSLIWHKNIYLFNWSWQSLMIGFHTDVAEWLDDEQNEWQKNLICRRSELQLRKKTDQEILENINRIPFWVMQTFIWTIFLQKMNLLEVIHTGQGICI